MEKALIYACKNNQLSVIKVLLTKKPDVNYTDDSGMTAQLYCAENGNLDGVKLLAAAGANMQQKDNHSNSLLHFAVKSRNAEITRFLLTLHSIDVNHCNAKGETPLYVATMSGNRDVVEMLIKAGAKDIPANNSKTALEIASERGSANLVELLLAATHHV
jgi:ankyrin repeat protein